MANAIARKWLLKKLFLNKAPYLYVPYPTSINNYFLFREQKAYRISFAVRDSTFQASGSVLISKVQPLEMKIIQENPFRVIGLLAGANARDIERQKARIKAHMEVGKDLHYETDMPVLNVISRDEDSVKTAFSSIEQNANKVSYGLFWFIDGSYVDEPTLDHLRTGEVERAQEVWTKMTNSGEVNRRNYSAFANLGTLKLALAFSGNGSVGLSELKEGISCKLRLINSHEYSTFTHLVADETYNGDPSNDSKKFVDECFRQFKPYLNKRNGIPAGLIPDIFKDLNDETRKYLFSKVTDPIILLVEEKVEKAKKNRVHSPTNAVKTGETLISEIEQDMNGLQNLLSASHPQYQRIVDKVASEALNCGIDFFMNLRDNYDVDPGPPAMALFLKAKRIALGPLVKARIDDNINGLQEWLDNKPARDKERLIGEDLAFIGGKLKQTEILPKSNGSAKDLVLSCKPSLQKIRQTFGAEDEFYLQLSSTVAAVALGISIDIVNKEQAGLQLSAQDPGLSMIKLARFKTSISGAMEVVDIIGRMDLDHQQRSRLQTNRSTLMGIKNQLDELDRRISSHSSSSSGGGSCYIATMAYGDYSHPQVMVLRKFRDETLEKSLAGRAFVRFYYAFSPYLVAMLKDKPLIKQCLRSTLDLFVQRLKKLQ